MAAGTKKPRHGYFLQQTVLASAYFLKDVPWNYERKCRLIDLHIQIAHRWRYLRTVVVGTPAYFAHYSPPETPADLDRHVCVNYRLLGGGGLLPWEFKDAGREVRLRVSGQLIVNDEVLAGATVRAGAGLGYMMERDVTDEIADGRLVQVLAAWCPSYPGCRLYYPDRRVTPALRALIGALRV